MLKFILLSILQSALLACGQTLLKLAMLRMSPFAWNGAYFKELFTNWYFLFTGMAFGCSTVLWLHILRNYPLSLAYPATSVAYVFGMVSAYLIFHENIPTSRLIGVVLIMAGVFFMVKQ